MQTGNSVSLIGGPRSAFETARFYTTWAIILPMHCIVVLVYWLHIDGSKNSIFKELPVPY